MIAIFTVKKMPFVRKLLYPDVDSAGMVKNTPRKIGDGVSCSTIELLPHSAADGSRTHNNAIQSRSNRPLRIGVILLSSKAG